MSDSFYASLQERNAPGLRTAAWLTLSLMPASWLLTHLTDQDTTDLSMAIRAAGMGAGLIILALLRGLPKMVIHHVNLFSFVLSVLVSCVVISLAWLHGGYSLELSLSLVLVFISIHHLFTWESKRAFVFYALISAFYMAPWALDALPMEWGGQQAYLGVAICLGLLTNQKRLLMEVEAHDIQSHIEEQSRKERDSLGELRDLDRLKSGFYASIVEGLRGPLTLMLSPLESMLSGDVGNFRANQIEYLETVRRNAMKVLRLTDDLVDLSHLEGGLLRLQTEPTNVVGLLQGVVDHAQDAAISKGSQINLETASDVIEINVDIEKLERAITHLVATAIQCTSRGGRVDVRSQRTSSGAEIVIRDNGAGLPPDWLTGFSNTPNKWLPPRSPDGVGLVLAREIVSLHGGQIDVVSRPETGTSFTVTLPTGRASEKVTQPGVDARTARLRSSQDYRFGEIQDVEVPAAVDHAPSDSKATKVLVVDDNPEILQFTKSLLSKDHAVFVAADGEAGLALAQSELPDVIITDTRMPKLDGTGLIRALREDPRLAQTPTIILTARNQVEDREAARESGADMVLDKPFNPRELRTAIQELFAKQHRQASTFMNEQARSFEIISAGLAHEMHNPLAYIKNAYFVIGESARKVLEAAQNPDLSPEERDKKMDKAKDKIDKMLPVANRGIKKVEQLVALMRRYAREGYSSDAIEMAIDESISTVLAMIAPKDDSEVHIEPDLQAPNATIKGVPEELQQAITNLTQNAVDAVGRGGHVWVRTRPEARHLRIEIADDGPGIPREALARIFTPFFTTKEVGKGMGLGLTITRQVIKQHGGTLDVDSTPGQGTTFTIRLPLATEESDADGGQSALEQAAEEPDSPTSPA